MADIQEAIRRMAYQYTVEGADKVKAAQDAVTASTTKTEQATLSLEKSFNNLERRYVSTVRQQQDYQKAQDKVNAAVAQNPALQERANVVLAALSKQYDQATGAQKAFAVATTGVNAQLVAMSAGAGPVGTFLAALGPWGFAASVGLGAASAVFNRLVEGAERAGDKAIELRKFADVTGLTVQQIKGLTQAGGRLGVDSEEISSSLEKFSIGLNEARERTGSLYEQVRRINPELSNQLALAPNAAKAWDILAQAIRGATDASQRNALARAAFGRGGIETGLVAIESATAGGIDNLAKASGLTKDWVDQTAKLRAENIQLEKSIKNTMDAAYALPVLQRQNDYLKVQKQITDEMLKTGKTPAPVGMGAGLPELVTRGPGDSASFNEAIAAAGKAARAGEEAAKAFKLDPETTAGWQQLDDAMGAAVLQSAQLVTSLQQQQKAAIGAANAEKERIGFLGAAATDQERLNAKTLELNALLINNTISQETYNRALGAAQFAADATLRGLQDQGELIRADTADEQARIKAAQAYRDIVKTTQDTQKAGAVAAQMMSNAREQADKRAQQREEQALQNIRTTIDAWGAYKQAIISWSVANDEAGKVLQRNSAAAEDAAFWYNKLAGSMWSAANAAVLAKAAFVPFSFHEAGDPNSPFTSQMWEKNGVMTQFNPAGYQSSYQSVAGAQIEDAKRIYGEGNFTVEAVPGPANTQNIVIVPKPPDPLSVSQQTAIISPAGDTPREQAINRQIAILQSMPDQSLGIALQIDALQKSLQENTDATKDNTSTTSAMTDVLSPFYSSDPRKSHLGFRTFAGGGIMTQYGELPLRQYQGGGMATSPQVALFGEGSTPEAYVPVPSGRIPVELKMPANSNQRPIQVNITVQGNADAGTVAALKQTGFQTAQQMRRVARG